MAGLNATLAAVVGSVYRPGMGETIDYRVLESARRVLSGR